MEPPRGWVDAESDGARLVLRPGGAWVVDQAAALDRALAGIAADGAREVVVELDALGRLDTAGAWLLRRTAEGLARSGAAVAWHGGAPAHRAMIARVARADGGGVAETRPSALVALLARMGRTVFDAAREARELLAFIGATVIAALNVAARPGRLRFTSLVAQLEQVGLNALPIVGLLAFLIGIVIAYQGADQLARFGAQIFTINLLGISILREMGILLTAIIVAGRTGSSFAAEIGTMQVNEEIDAMRTLGLDPVEVLVLPRVLALVIAVPLLTAFANAAGIAGGAVMSLYVLDIPLAQFFTQFRDVVPVASFWVGFVKAPVFGFLIAVVGCRHGLRVAGSAESVGRETTRAVVISIFLVIVFDALFSILFSMMGV